MIARAMALAVLALPAAAGDPTVDIPVYCGEVVCVLPKGYWLAMMKAHNEHVDEIVKLRGQLKGRARICSGEKES